MKDIIDVAEQKRLNDARDAGIPWKKWGPYLSERQWGTVREDYSADGNAWEYFTHDHSRSRAYKWGEDGLGGICDEQQRLCFAIALWNERDPIPKERLFGLTNSEGNHGEDVKKYYFYIDSTLSHSYMKYLYKYPQREFPYRDLVETNRRLSREQFEYELLDSGVFDDDRYFDVFVEYAKEGPDDLLIRITVHNRLKVRSTVGLLPLCASTFFEAEDMVRHPKLMELIELFKRRHPELFAHVAPSVEGWVGSQEYKVQYLPAESNTSMFGGNSNWRGPVWIPVNGLIIRGLLNLYGFYVTR